jgi:hypothetical protein
MAKKTIVVGLVSVSVLLTAVVCMAAVNVIQLSSVGHFRADCSGLLVGGDTSPQMATCKGTLIGSNAPITFTLNNVGLVGTDIIDNCALKAGTAKIGDAGANTISMTLGGSGCATNGALGTGRFAEAYWIESGTGTFMNAKGTGSFSVGFDQPGGQMLIHMEGNITGVTEEGE